jgi:23S rRNA (adenine2503-C2)-methyltransferase
MDFTKQELEQIIKPAFRVKQIFHWVYAKYADDFSQMQNLPKQMKESLANEYMLNPLKIAAKQESSDGSIKYLFTLQDNHNVEAVLLKMSDTQYHEDGTIKHLPKYTVCVSTQVGCKVGCAFCLTAKGGFVRNLTPGEIVAQVVSIKKDVNLEVNRKINIVYMGMGEPLDNFDNLVKAIEIFKDQDGLSISPQRQTVSTSGLGKQIYKLGAADLGVNLAISLHAVDDALRTKLMPINKAYNIETVIKAVKEFPINARKRVMFEYLVIKDLNDDIASAKKLAKLLNGIKAKVNLIYFNDYEGSPFKRPVKEDMLQFQQLLQSKGITCTIRESKGLDISAACGQLREQKENDGVC